MRILRKLADVRQVDSLATKLRRKRFALLKPLISAIPRPLKILDVGGTQIFWEMVEFTGVSDIEIVLLNLSKVEVHHPNFRSIVGDARKMEQFKDKEFDLVFSNSVIEHVGGYDDQRRMADEISRVGNRYILQTPNRRFPVEPHFLFPFFQFFPLWLKVWLITHFNVGWYSKISDRQNAVRVANSIRLLNRQELNELFPHATLREEKLLGFVKSFTVYYGFDLGHHKGVVQENDICNGKCL